MTRDRIGSLMQVVLALIGIAAVLVAVNDRRRANIGEFFSLLTAAAAGMAFFVTAQGLMTLFLGLEWFSIALYILTAMEMQPPPVARGGAQVPHRRLVRLGHPPLRLRAHLRRHR